MQNPIQKFGQISLVLEKTKYFVRKFENFDKLQIPYSSIFFAQTSHKFPTYQCTQKEVRDFFYFVQILSYLQKLKRPGFYTLVFTFLLITQEVNKIKKISSTLFQILLVENVCKISAKNINFYDSWSSSKFSIFQTKNPGFLEIIDLCLNLGIRFCIT